MLDNIKNSKVLIVDDNAYNLSMLKAYLSAEGYRVQAVPTGHMALIAIERELPDLILLDIMMPEMGGFEICKHLKKDEKYQDIPIIFISALDDLQSKIKAFSIGGVDYIAKPFQKEEVLARVNTHLKLCKLQKKIETRNTQLQKKIQQLKKSEEALDDARVNLEKRVRERTKQLDIYRKVVSTSNEHLAFLNTSYQYQFINDTYKKSFNLSDDDLIGKTPAQLFGEERFNKEIKPNLDRCLSGENINYEFKRVLADSRFQIMDVFMRPYHDECSNITGCVVATRDITEQKKYEDMINQAYTELDQIFNSAGDGMYLIDNTFTVIRANTAFHKMWNVGRDKLLGKKCYDFFSYDICGSNQCYFERILRGEELLKFDYSATINCSEKYFSMTVAPFRDTYNTIKGIVVNVKDITQKIAAEKQEKLRQQQMIQTDKLAAIGMLAAGIAHEINNPNGVIMLNIPMLSSYWKGAEPVFEKLMEANNDFKLGKISYSKFKNRFPYILEQTLESSRRIKRIVSELKDFARQDVLEMTEVNINDVVRASINLVSSKIKKTTNRFEVCYDHDLNPVKGNFQRLEQVIINVLINACEAITDSDKGIYVNISSDKKKRIVQIHIRDEGTGIKEKHLKDLFNPFFTTKRDLGGTGLGLSVSHSIIMEHNGTMNFESVAGQGSLCIVTLPIML